MKSKILIFLAGVFAIALISSSCADPRKNCNHPKHWQWVKEKQAKRTPFQP